MNKKGGKSQIPDFSNKRLQKGPGAAQQPKQGVKQMPARTTNVKPQATSSKSGRRGS